MIDVACDDVTALNRARSVLGQGQYALGTGDYNPNNCSCGRGPVDLPWTTREEDGLVGSDCAGFAICWCWMLHRHRPGFNKGTWATVEDDINVNSILEDAEHKKELTWGIIGSPELPRPPMPGDLVCYPTFKAKNHTFVGHVAIIEKVSYDFLPLRYDKLTVIQCHGPDKFKPGVVRTDGSLFMHHDSLWPGDENKDRRCKIVRMRTRE